MGAFEDKIKFKLEEGKIPLRPDVWSGMETRLDNVQMSDLVFTQKLSNALNYSVIPYAPEHWKNMNKRLDDGARSQSMEKSLQSKFAQASISASPRGWDSLLSKLEGKEKAFEGKVKSKLEEGSIGYNSDHWNAIASQLPRSKSRLPYYMAAALASLVILSYGVYQFSSIREKEKNASTVSKKLNSNKELPVNQQNYNSKNEVVAPNLEGSFSPLDNGSADSDGNLELRSTNTGQIQNNNVAVANNKFPSLLVPGLTQKEVPSNKQSESLIAESKELQAIELGNELDAVNLELPSLSEQNSIIETVDLRPDLTLHIGLSPWLTMVNNPVFTGIYGKRQVSLNYDQEYKSFFQYGNNLENRWNHPLILKGGYEQQLNRFGLNVGGAIVSKNTDSWRYTTVDLNLAKEQNLGDFKIRIGVDVELQRNKLLTKELSLLEQSSGNSVQSELISVDQKIPVDQYITVGAGLMVMNKYLMFSYRIENIGWVRLNYNNEKVFNHEVMTIINVPMGAQYGLSAISRFEYDGVNYFMSPGLAFSYKNGLYALGEYQYMNRAILNVGYQFNSGLRVFAAYGQSSQKELESRLRNMYSYSGHIGFGVNYIFNK